MLPATGIPGGKSSMLLGWRPKWGQLLTFSGLCGLGEPALELSLEEWPDPKDWSLQDTDAFVLVYDICSPDSFDYVKALRQRIAETRPAGAPEAPILVVGNKRDRQRLRFGPRRALAALVRRGWRCGYLECSAKYNWHVLRLFRELLRCALVRSRPAHPALRLQGALHPARCILM
ncbi:ras-like protein family member 10A isoform X2 [Sus scrofa]|uniref:ras-like protein family member 10A isoform X2 n=1 Tax=Sus scrofa TaxID=9823 RepID=UPI000A2AF19B|nr:ras-like protein family member 10A isoform X2 [Sus scrofa]